MWSLHLNNIDAVTGLAIAAVFCTISVQRLLSRQSELFSEILSWMILPILFKMASRLAGKPKITPSDSRARSTSSQYLWIAATSLAISLWYKAENGVVAYLPTLTPLLLVAQERLSLNLPTFSLSYSSRFSPPPLIWSTTLIALFCTLTLSNGGAQGSVLSSIAVVAQFIVYAAFLPKTITSSRLIPTIDDIEDAIVPFAWRAVVTLTIAMCIHTTIFGFTMLDISSTLLLGMAKALSWYFVAQTARRTSWCIATAIETFSLISTCDPFIQSSEAQAIANVVASFLALLQVVRMLPTYAKARYSLWVFCLVFLVPYLANHLAIRSAQSSAQLSFRYFQKHPVEILTDSARTSFEVLSQKQSKSYSAAYSEYRRRYDAEPPSGFEAWYDFAASHQSPIIDDFDMIYNLVSPFWELSGDEVLQAMMDLQAISDSELWLCVFSSNQAKTHCSHPYRTFDRHIELLFNRLLGSLPMTLPDVKFLVNHLDEPRILTPPQRFGIRDDVSSRQFNLTNLSQQSVWNTLRKNCAPQQRDEAVETFALPFVTDPFSTRDLCQHQEYQAMHGLIMSPTSFRLIEGLVPILSTGSLSTMGDIVFPSPAYIEAEFEYEGAYDIEWDKKRNNLYWAGSTTGGFASNGQWRYFHRQRFVSLAQNLERKRHFYLREQNGVVGRVESAFLNSRLFDVAFTKIFQCERRHCREEHAYFKVKAWANKNRALQSRLVFDMDGNGISGRYYQLLASKSVPLKQTLLREWHDDRLVPWVHYIPVSQSMEELPELVSYLTSNEKGQQIAWEIGERGRDWYFKALREVDMGIYTYRLVLELARLQDPKREAGST